MVWQEMTKDSLIEVHTSHGGVIGEPGEGPGSGGAPGQNARFQQVLSAVMRGRADVNCAILAQTYATTTFGMLKVCVRVCLRVHARIR